MSTIESKNTYRNLKKKGFVDSTKKSSDHKYLEFYHNDKLILYTKLSHSSKKDLENFLIGQMSFQCKLDKNNFIELAKCPMSRDDYLKILKNKGLLN